VEVPSLSGDDAFKVAAMPILSKSKLLAALLVVAALLALPAAASATLAYTVNVFKPRIYVAQDNGKGARQIGPGLTPHVSPNGKLVVFERMAKNHTPEMKLYDIATGKTKTIFSPWRETYDFAWSPDSTMVAALRGGELGSRSLYVIDVESGKATKIATGYFDGVTFSPDSEEVAFGLAASMDFPAKTDIVRDPVTGGPTSTLTHDHISAYPLWGPQGQIVFAKQLGAKSRKYGPKNDLFLMNADGKAVKRLTHTEVNPLSLGLTPTAWSQSGNQLLTEFGGQDTSYAVTVNPKTGAERNLSPGNSETGFAGVALSADGKTVLGELGGFEGAGANSKLKIVSVPYGGGKQKVLVTGGFNPSWGG
jgi:Tol biopolymer transport system component